MEGLRDKSLEELITDVARVSADIREKRFTPRSAHAAGSAFESAMTGMVLPFPFFPSAKAPEEQLHEVLMAFEALVLERAVSDQESFQGLHSPTLEKALHHSLHGFPL